MPEGFPYGMKFLPEDWQKGDRSDGPGSAAIRLPQGFLFGAPNVILPYGRMPSDDYYGAQVQMGDPFLNAPLQDSCGGTVYFEATKEDYLKALVRLMGLRAVSKEYVAFAISSTNPVEDRYLDQIKILTHLALTEIFRIDDELIPEEQPFTIEESILGFVAAQNHKWNEPNRTFSSRLSGSAGGDDDWAKEALAFGLHVENSYWGAYRIWSRPWLVTK